MTGYAWSNVLGMTGHDQVHDVVQNNAQPPDGYAYFIVSGNDNTNGSVFRSLRHLVLTGCWRKDAEQFLLPLVLYS